MDTLAYLLRRAARYWQMLITLSLGVILSTALLASSPLLVDTVIHFGLQQKLRASEPLESNVRLACFVRPDEVEYEELDAQIQATVQEHFGPYLDRVIRGGGTHWMLPWLRGELVEDERVNLRFYEEIEDQIDFRAGGWPSGTTAAENAATVVIGEEMATAYELQVGDRLPLSTKKGTEPTAWIQVAGIAHPLNPNAPYWFGPLSPLRSQSSQSWAAQYNAVIPPEAFFITSAELLPRSGYELSWHILLNPGAITVANIPRLRAQIASLETELKTLETRIVLETGLEQMLNKFVSQAEIVRVPLYLLTVEVVLLTLYYVTMVAVLSVGQVEREFAILRSRGASGWQIFRIQLTEASLISGIAFLSGPVFGAGLVRGLAWVGPLKDVSQVGWGLSLTQVAWLATAAGAVGCTLSLLLPVGPALRRSIVTHQQTVSRTARIPWWQRFYLDVFVLLAGLIMLWRLHLYGGIVAGSSSHPRLDWLLLLAPVALLLGSATILLRIFPLILRLLARISARGRGLTSPLAMWQASRNPTHVARLVLLLTLSIALGVLSTGLNATLDTSEAERSRYAAGSDVRLASQGFVTLPDYQNVSGVQALASAWRSTGSIDLRSRRTFPRFEVLAVEPEAFASVITYRDDFAERPIDELLLELTSTEELLLPVIPVPGRPTGLGLWVRAPVEIPYTIPQRQKLDGSSHLDRIGLWVKLQTAQGQMFSLELERWAAMECGLDARFCSDKRDGPVNAQGGWGYFHAPLPDLPEASFPLSLHSLWIQNRTRAGNQPRGTHMELALDDLTVMGGDIGEALVVESFEDPTLIWLADTNRFIGTFTRSDPRSGGACLKLILPFSRGFQIVGFRMYSGLTVPPLPALVSPAFLEVTQLQVGDTLNAWINSLPHVRFEIVGTLRYFPTLYEETDASFMVTTLDPLLTRLNNTTINTINSNEIWLTVYDQASTDKLAAMTPAVGQVWETERLRKTIKADPMSLGLRSVTFFGYALTTLLSLVGFATHFYLSARQRETSYGILRSMGLSPRQLYSSLALEQIILILTGLALGTILGLLLNQLVLPRLPIALGDRPPIPPFISKEDWGAVGRIYLTLALAFLASLGLATWLLWRARVHRVLRIGEE